MCISSKVRIRRCQLPYTAKLEWTPYGVHVGPKVFSVFQVQKHIGRVAELIHYLQVSGNKSDTYVLEIELKDQVLEKAPRICCWDLFYQVRHHTLLSCKSILARVTLICHQVYFVKYGIILKLLILKQLKSSSYNTTSQFWKTWC